MSDTVKGQWNRAKDNTVYYANRAESKLSETKNAIQRSYEDSQIKDKLNALAFEVEQKVEPFWNRNKDNIIVGSAIAAGSLIILMSTRI